MHLASLLQRATANAAPASKIEQLGWFDALFGVDIHWLTGQRRDVKLYISSQKKLCRGIPD
jgi:hypothetical protein